MNPGSILPCRNLDWVPLSSHESDFCQLRPLTRATDEVVAVRKGLAELAGYALPGPPGRNG
jgi:hypothetical protein